MSVALLTEYVSPQVLNEVSKLDKEKQEKLINLFLSQKKNKGLAIGLSVIGLHYAYLQKWGLFILYGITGGGFLIWWLIDLFRVSGLTVQENDQIIYRLMSVV